MGRRTVPVVELVMKDRVQGQTASQVRVFATPAPEWTVHPHQSLELVRQYGLILYSRHQSSNSSKLLLRKGVLLVSGG